MSSHQISKTFLNKQMPYHRHLQGHIKYHFGILHAQNNVTAQKYSQVLSLFSTSRNLELLL